MADGDLDPHVLAPGRAPTPFTAVEIRAGCPEGRTVRLLVEVDGVPVAYRTSRFVDVDADGATLESERLTLTGESAGPPEATRVTWLDLQGHASFPVEVVTIEPDSIETPLGRLDCLRYTARDGAKVDTFWFATAIPGMPVMYTTEEAGRVTLRVTMVKDAVA